MSNRADLEDCNAELKEAYRSIYTLVKNLDEQKKTITKIHHIFEPEINKKRLNLIQRCQALLFKDHQVIGKKSREILWRKGYYEFIAFVKKYSMKDGKTEYAKWSEKLKNLILEGITNYKWIAITLEKLYDLDLQLLIDFSILKNENFDKITVEYQLNELIKNYDDKNDGNHQQQQKSLEAVAFALDTIHSSLLSLGDLHRYYIDFKFTENDSESRNGILITKELASRYYHQAFQLNSTIGMAQNQLGTLYYGQNYDLESIYHYLYSLICTVPFDLSETNVCKLFTAHAEYLEDLNPDKVEFNLRDFYARFYLIIDIFFFDKNVPDFNSLCHCVLIDLRKVLCSKTLKINEGSIFKIVCMLLFCMSKLKMINSDKVHSLNAFIVAVCSDLIDSCIVNLEQFLLSKSKQNEKFQEMYMNEFNKFEANVRKSREDYKLYCEMMDKEQKSFKNTEKENRKLDIDSKPIAVPLLNGKKFSSTEEEIHQKSSECEKQSLGDKIETNGISIIKRENGAISRSSGDSQPKSLSNKSGKFINVNRKKMKMRRRRRRHIRSEDDDYNVSQDYESSCSFDDDADEDEDDNLSDSELDTDFSSEEEDNDVSDLSSNFDSDFDDIEEKPCLNNEKDTSKIEETFNENNQHQDYTGGSQYSDGEDVIIEEEQIIYPNDLPNTHNDFIENFNSLNHMMNDVLHFKNEIEDDNNALQSLPKSTSTGGVALSHVIDDNRSNGTRSPKAYLLPEEPPVKMKYKNKYTKYDPNIVIEFVQNEITMRALKILFDWLHINHEILIGCFNTNPEFIHKIMKLLNYCNIDIFTRKVYFEKEFIKTDNVRENLDQLFDVRQTIPLSEDMILKGFDLLQQTQATLDWETPIRDKVTKSEESIMRIFKMIDFGFFLCKLKKFNYNFCSKARRFTENMKRRGGKKTKSLSSSSSIGMNRRRRDRDVRGDRDRKSRNYRNDRYSRRKRDDDDGYHRTNRRQRDKITGKRNSRYHDKQRQRDYENVTDESSKNEIVVKSVIPRKGYLRNKQNQLESCSDEGMQQNHDQDLKRQKGFEEKCKLMGKLWLKNEVETLEAKLKQKPMHVILTPFIVVDAKALTEYTSIVQALVKTKEFIVLIPNAVLGELDQLKKHSDGARNAIRWLEQEFKVGNRFMRAQRDHESAALLLIKIPKKLDRESSVFIQIAKFCNFIVTNHSADTTDEYDEANLVTFLSGDNLKERKSSNLSITGILDAIPVRHDQISNFYEKFMKK